MFGENGSGLALWWSDTPQLTGNIRSIHWKAYIHILKSATIHGSSLKKKTNPFQTVWDLY